ncbi:hypothetical protein ACFE04_004526 [Oxalis oulophora]
MAKELPPAIISDVLCHLPVKSLLRFTCLSKTYSSEIHSPNFIKRHYTKSLQTNTNLSLVITDIGVECLMPSSCIHQQQRNITSLDFDTLNNPLTLCNPLDKSRVVGSCNGLLCLCNFNGQLTLFNPATRKHRSLPLLHKDFPHGNAVVWTHGFGYNRSEDDYYVIRIAQIAELDGGRLIGSELMVYRLSENVWKRVVKDFPFALSFDQRMGIYVSGKLHFDFAPVSQLCTDLEDRTYVVVAFDLDLNNYTQLPLPSTLTKGKFRFKLSVLGGCLCVCPYTIRGFHSVWLMKEYGVMDSWTKIISFPKGIQEGIWYPVAYSLNEDKVLFQARNSIFYWYDLTKKRMIKINMAIPLPILSVAVASVNSLVSLKSRNNVKKTASHQTNKSDGTGKPKMDSTNKSFLVMDDNEGPFFMALLTGRFQMETTLGVSFVFR